MTNSTTAASARVRLKWNKDGIEKRRDGGYSPPNLSVFSGIDYFTFDTKKLHFYVELVDRKVMVLVKE